jgi:hypothetical protein
MVIKDVDGWFLHNRTSLWMLPVVKVSAKPLGWVPAVLSE